MNYEDKNYTIPSPLVSNEEKQKKSYGLSYAKAICSDWIYGGYNNLSCDFHTKRDKIRINRLYSRAWQSTKNYKALMDNLNFTNIDWTPINIAGKFIDIVANSPREDLYKVDISAIDRTSIMERNKYQDRLQRNLLGKNIVKQTKELLNVTVPVQGYVPEDEEDMQMHMDFKYKPNVEILEELLIKYVQKTNNFDIIKKVVNRDLTENGFGVVRCYTDKTNGVTLRSVDIENFIHSYTNKIDYSDCNYFADFEEMTISRLKQISDLEEKELREIAKLSSSLSANSGFTTYDYASCDFRELLGLKVVVMNFTFKTSKSIKYKKKFYKNNKSKMIPKKSDYNAKERSDFKIKNKVLDTWYEGCYIVNTECIFNYKESENLSRDKMNKAMPEYIVFASDIYQNKTNSLLDRMKTPIEEMTRIGYKIQQLTNQMRPDETEIDVDLLAELVTKTGGKLQWEDIVDLFASRGILLSSRSNLGDDGIKDRPALRTPPQNRSGKIQDLMSLWMFYYNMIRDITGVNPARDGSQASDTLVGIQKANLDQSNTATKSITDASMEITRKAAETISTRIGDIFRFSKELKSIYINAVGSKNIELLESLKSRHLHEFGFIISILPSEVEIQEFKESLAIALQEGSISVDEKITAERIVKQNVKQAESYLIYRRKKNVEEKQRLEQEKFAAQSQGNMQSAQAAEQAKQQTLIMASELKIKEAKELALIEIMKQNELNKINKPKEQEGYNVDILKEKIRAKSRIDEKSFSEDRKDERQKMIDTHQSKMIDQRKKEYSSPINFKENDLDTAGLDFLKE